MHKVKKEPIYELAKLRVRFDSFSLELIKLDAFFTDQKCKIELSGTCSRIIPTTQI